MPMQIVKMFIVNFLLTDMHTSFVLQSRDDLCYRGHCDQRHRTTLTPVNEVRTEDGGSRVASDSQNV